MNLREIEKQLSHLREDGNMSFTTLREKGLPRETVLRIESGENYNVESLFRYLSQLFYVLTVDGEVTEDEGLMGAFLREKRKAAGKSLLEMASEAHITINSVSCVENGKGYRRATLLAYIGVVPVDFGIESMFDAYK